jgi:hypothetical protein
VYLVGFTTEVWQHIYPTRFRIKSDGENVGQQSNNTYETHPLPKEVTNDTMKYTMSHTSPIITLIKRVEQLSRPELSARIHLTTWKSTNDRFERA